MRPVEGLDSEVGAGIVDGFDSGVGCVATLACSATGVGTDLLGS